jgi:hypothetical protein
MLDKYPFVFIGSVESVDSDWYDMMLDFPTPEPHDPRTPLPTHPALGEPKPTRVFNERSWQLPASHYAVTVERVFQGRQMAVGTTVTLHQDGGIFEEDGRLVGWVAALDPLIDVGARYLVFAGDAKRGQFVVPPPREGLLWAPPWGKFRIVDGRLADSDWDLPITRLLDGRSESALEDLLTAAAAAERNIDIGWSLTYLGKTVTQSWTQSQLTHLVSHELGHTLGLSHHGDYHNEDPVQHAIMYNMAPRNDILGPTTTDLGSKVDCRGLLRCPPDPSIHCETIAGLVRL